MAKENSSLDLFGDPNITSTFMKQNIESIVHNLSRQFEEVEDSYRELVQNSIDSVTPQIDIYHEAQEIDDLNSKVTLHFSTTFSNFPFSISSFFANHVSPTARTSIRFI